MRVVILYVHDVPDAVPASEVAGLVSEELGLKVSPLPPAEKV